MTMAGMRKLVDEDFSMFDVGHLFADFTAQGEYYHLPRPTCPNGWYDPINHTGGRAGRLKLDQSSWCIRKVGSRQVLAQTIGAKAKHEAYLLVMGEKQVGPATIEAELKTGTPRECGIVFNSPPPCCMARDSIWWSSSSPSRKSSPAKRSAPRNRGDVWR